MCVHSHHARPAARQGSALQPRQAMSFAPAGAPSGAERAGCAACPKRVCNLIVRATLYSIDRMRAFMIDRSWIRSQRAARPAGKGAPVGAGGRRRARGAVPTVLGTLRCAALGALLADIDACVRIDTERARIHMVDRRACVQCSHITSDAVVELWEPGRPPGKRVHCRSRCALPRRPARVNMHAVERPRWKLWRDTHTCAFHACVSVCMGACMHVRPYAYSRPAGEARQTRPARGAS